MRKKGITTLKILISAALIYFIFTKLNVAEIFETVKKSNPFYLIFALAIFIISKVIAAFRLNSYFHELRIFLTHKSNLKLYLLGMFYNLFLPGGIGGDAYKGYVIKKKFEIETKKVVSVLVLDRLSGLHLLFIYACGLALFLNNSQLENFKILIGLAIPLSVVVFYFLNKKFLGYVLSVFWKSFGYSALVQLSQLICVYFILISLGVETSIVAYLVIFLISSIVSVIPLTIGGIGSRELTFFYGAALLGLNESTSVAVSMLFFLITAVVSLLGVYYAVGKPELEVHQ
ncbi:flippase-like domain-containing protein [Maribacter algarum]|uniref:Flippase-like domain-containing protein n=1 Tax=Maribacter algarum (ex Zhang et al. 2020) TaxID=2578118 RepID=A0A5S3PMF4_9FLAO|nr:flippase-like domain-containing protein [Maribacter algarum]